MTGLFCFRRARSLLHQSQIHPNRHRPVWPWLFRSSIMLHVLCLPLVVQAKQTFYRWINNSSKKNIFLKMRFVWQVDEIKVIVVVTEFKCPVNCIGSPQGNHTPAWANTQLISELFSYLYKPFLKSVNKTSPYTNIKQHTNIKHKSQIWRASPFIIMPVKTD